MVEVRLQRGVAITPWMVWILGGFTAITAVGDVGTHGPWWWVAVAWFAAANGFLAVGKLAWAAWQAYLGRGR